MNNPTLKQGDKVVIVWTKNDQFTQQDAVFQSYVKGRISETTPLFLLKNENILGEDCFWLLKKNIKQSSDIAKYQQMIEPMQVAAYEMAAKAGQPPIDKLKKKEITQLGKERAARVNRFQRFIDKFGFDPTDETWIEEHLAKDETERKWFTFVREHGITSHSEDGIGLFNKKEKENITLNDAKKMTKKRMRYVLGSFNIRYQGENDIEKWKKDAIAFEEKFESREQRMAEWTKKQRNQFPIVTTLKPIEFWSGTMFAKCLEKIPHVFTSPDCEYIKAGVSLEVRGYDPQEKWIDLDFTPDVREMLTGSTERDEDAQYAIVVHPSQSNRLSGIEKLK